jgi:putative component of toxin-antitoxin plasmid stabilization module
VFTIKRMPEFDEWFDGLRDRTTSIRLGVRLDKA